MDDFENRYGNQYDDLKLYPEQSIVIPALLGIVGAIIGALPGFGLWLLIAKCGYISAYCGALLALGAVLGFNFASKKNQPPAAVGIIVCMAIVVGAAYLATNIDWAWSFADFFDETVKTSVEGELAGYSSSEIDKVYSDALMELFGFSEASFSNCFRNLGTLIDYYDMKSDYCLELVKALGMAVIGGIGGIAGIAKYNKK